ncbi:MAG: arsenate reductase ArsC [Bacteroidota bacterium]|nr:arsenate reductase ArsC [Bacteroidota bacterium]
MNKKILILCTGNSCRSQMAEGFLKSFDNTLDVLSAGTNPAKSMNLNTIIVMDEVGIDVAGQFPKDVNKFIDDSFDYVITVCDNVKDSCPVFTGKVKHRLHLGFVDPADAKGTKVEILNEYREVRDEIKRSFRHFYNTKLK